MQAERNFTKEQWQAPVDKAIAEADGDVGNQQEAIARIKLEWGLEAAEYAERRFAEQQEQGDQAAFANEQAKLTTNLYF
jgi:hypothetical protein